MTRILRFVLPALLATAAAPAQVPYPTPLPDAVSGRPVSARPVSAGAISAWFVSTWFVSAWPVPSGLGRAAGRNQPSHAEAPRQEEQDKDKDASDSNSVRVPLRTADGTLRELDEKALYLETNKDKILKFRVLPKTQFHDKEGEQVRDSLLRPGDQLSVEVNGDDPETALRVILTRKSTDAERARAEKTFDHGSAQPPVEADTHTAGAMEVTAEPSAKSQPDTSDSGAREIPTLARAGKSDSTQPAETQPVEKTASPVENANQAPPPNAPRRRYHRLGSRRSRPADRGPAELYRSAKYYALFQPDHSS